MENTGVRMLIWVTCIFVRIEEAESHRIPLHWKTAKGKTVPQKKAYALIDGKSFSLMREFYKEVCQNNPKSSRKAAVIQIEAQSWQGATKLTDFACSAGKTSLNTTVLKTATGWLVEETQALSKLGWRNSANYSRTFGRRETIYGGRREGMATVSQKHKTLQTHMRRYKVWRLPGACTWTGFVNVFHFNFLWMVVKDGSFEWKPK